MLPVTMVSKAFLFSVYTVDPTKAFSSLALWNFVLGPNLNPTPSLRTEVRDLTPLETWSIGCTPGFIDTAIVKGWGATKTPEATARAASVFGFRI